MKDDFDRQFAIMQKIIFAFFCIVATIAVVTAAFNMWIAYQVVSDPSMVGQIGGQILNGFLDTVNK